MIVFTWRAFLKRPISLAAEWRALLAIAITMTRQVLRLEEISPRKALQKAELLDAWAVCALTRVVHQIEADGRAVQAAKPFQEQLAPIAAILLYLLILIRPVIRRLRGHISQALPAVPPARPAEPYLFSSAGGIELLNPG